MTSLLQEKVRDEVEAYQQLEVELAQWLNSLPGNGQKYAPEQVVSCASGSSALLLALEALKLPPGSEVVTGDLNMISIPRAISLAGLTPVFVDCDANLLMDSSLLSQAYCPPESRAVVTVHIYGRQVDMGEVMDVVDNRGGYVVEDLAEAHGVAPHPQTDAACLSFFRNKVLFGEEGGMVAFRDPKHATLARQLRSMGFTEAHNFIHVSRGWNHRLSNANAKLVLQNLRTWDVPVMAWGIPGYLTVLEQRRLISRWWDEALPPEWRMPERDVTWVHDVRVSGLTREKQFQVVKALNATHIEARISFWPMHLQEEFKSCRVVGNGNAERMANEVFYLPCDPGTVSEEMVATGARIIQQTLLT